jgi:DNA transformation protein
MPESALDDPDEAADLARLALAAAQRAKAAPNRSSKTKGGNAVPPRSAGKSR